MSAKFNITVEITPHEDGEHCYLCRWGDGAMCNLFAYDPRLILTDRDAVYAQLDAQKRTLRGCRPDGRIEDPWVRCPACFAAEAASKKGGSSILRRGDPALQGWGGSAAPIK